MAELDNRKEVLGNPIIDQPSEIVQKLRRNLLISASLSLLYFFGDFDIENARPLGIEISGFTEFKISVVLLFLVSYHLIYFLWHTFDYVGVWRIRNAQNVGASEFPNPLSNSLDHPQDAGQYNLYKWWVEQAPRIGNLSKRAREFEEAAAHLRETAEATHLRATEKKSELIKWSQGMSHHLSRIDNNVKNLTNIMNDESIKISLARFDGWFGFFKKSQIYRLFLMEFGVPLVWGVLALICIIINLVDSAHIHFVPHGMS